MATTTARETTETVADLLKRLGGIPASRVLLHPAPGKATERDLIRLLDASDKRLCELIDGVLVEKTIGTEEAALANFIAAELTYFVRSHKLGLVLGADGAHRLWPGRVRVPDVAFTSRERIARNLQRGEITGVAPDLAVEVLSKGNTRQEMTQKLDDYFRAGVRLVWYVDPKTRTTRVYTSPKDVVLKGENDPLDGGDVLPGFALVLHDLFDEAKGSPPA